MFKTIHTLAYVVYNAPAARNCGLWIIGYFSWIKVTMKKKTREAYDTILWLYIINVCD